MSCGRTFLLHGGVESEAVAYESCEAESIIEEWFLHLARLRLKTRYYVSNAIFYSFTTEL